MNIKVCLFGALFSLSQSWAGPIATSGAEGHGGDGVLIERVPYLLDLVEIGIEKNLYFDKNVVVEAFILDAIKSMPKDFIVPENLLASKLSEIFHFDRVFGYSLILSMKSHLWSMVPYDLVDVKDQDDTVIDFSIPLVQLAVRQDTFIVLAEEWWNKMDDSNKVALIIHELIYSVNYPSEKKQDGAKVRHTTALFFSETFPKINLKWFISMNQDRFPNSGNLPSQYADYDEPKIKKLVTCFSPVRSQNKIMPFVIGPGLDSDISKFFSLDSIELAKEAKRLCDQDSSYNFRESKTDIQFRFSNFTRTDGVPSTYLEIYGDAPTDETVFTANEGSCESDFINSIQSLKMTYTGLCDQQ